MKDADALAIAIDALRYIVEHAWAAEKPKWGNEFVDVAREALEKIGGLREPDVSIKAGNRDTTGAEARKRGQK